MEATKNPEVPATVDFVVVGECPVVVDGKELAKGAKFKASPASTGIEFLVQIGAIEQAKGKK
jgi:hypothetical protein